MEKMYMVYPEGTGWVEDILKNCPQVLDTNDVLIHRNLSGDLVYLVEVELIAGNAKIEEEEIRERAYID